MTDPLGRRGVRPSFLEPRGNPMLSDDALCAIANDVRTKPLTEVGRHVMPLIQHAAELNDRNDRLVNALRILLTVSLPTDVSGQRMVDEARGVLAHELRLRANA